MSLDDSPPRVLIIGASGTTGSRLVQQLLARGIAVTAGSRTADGPEGARSVRFEWYDSGTYDDALAGADCVYLIPPSRDAEPQAVMLPFLDRARARGVRRAVLLSSSVVPQGGPGPGLVQQALAETFAERAVLRPSWMMQNVTGDHPHARSIRARRMLTTATDDGRVAFVDAGDIARVARQALIAPAALNTDLILTGPETLSYDDVAHILSAASGQTITHVKVTVAEMRAFYQAGGLPAASAEFLASLDQAIASGIENRTTDAVEQITGAAPRSFRAFTAAEFSLSPADAPTISGAELRPR